jgi:hypothetical protein
MEYECIVTNRGTPEMWRVKHKPCQRVFAICTDGDKVYLTGTHPPIYQNNDGYSLEKSEGSIEVYPPGAWFTIEFFNEYYIKDC